MIDWPLKGRIVCAACLRPVSPQTIRYRNLLYRYYRCRSTAGGRAPCGHRVSAQAIEDSVEVNVSRRLGQGSLNWDLIDVVIYAHRHGGYVCGCSRPLRVDKARAGDTGYRNRSTGTRRSSASCLACALLMLRLPFRISDTRLLGNTVQRSLGFMSFSSSR